MSATVWNKSSHPFLSLWLFIFKQSPSTVDTITGH